MDTRRCKPTSPRSIYALLLQIAAFGHPLAEESVTGGCNLPSWGLLPMQALEVGSGPLGQGIARSRIPRREVRRSWGPDSRWRQPMAPGFLAPRENQSRASRTGAWSRAPSCQVLPTDVNGIANTSRKQEIVVKFSD